MHPLQRDTLVMRKGICIVESYSDFFVIWIIFGFHLYLFKVKFFITGLLKIKFF